MQIADLAEFQTPVKQGDRLEKIPFAEVQMARPRIGEGQSAGMVGGFGEPDTVLRHGKTLGERALLGQSLD